MNNLILARLSQVLPGWYKENKRDLPWRHDKDPYHIWVSEIMLQQTRVEAVKGYYSRFLQALPTIADLANADDELLHKLWEGLGYYSRVRNLKKAAQVIMEQHGGVFPGEYEEVLGLPGIGQYTAGAICSIAFNQKTPAVDGNVLRLYSRLLLDETPVDLPEMKKRVNGELAAVYPDCAGDLTQALMELGATVCGPNRAPACESCPCKDFCLAHKENKTDLVPVRLPKKERRQEDKTVFILTCGDQLALHKRPDSGLLAGLWELPNVSGKLDPAAAVQAVTDMGLKVENIEKTVERKHIFTHIQWNMRGVYISVKEPCGDLTWLSREEIRNCAALPTAFRQFFED